MKTKLWKLANKGLRIRYSTFTYHWYLELQYTHGWAAINKSATVSGIIAHKHDYIRSRANDHLAGRGGII